MIALPSEQRNPYKGSPPRPWVRLRLTAPDGSTHDIELMPSRWRVIRCTSGLAAVAWLVFHVQLDLFAWSQANADSATPIASPIREMASFVFGFPLFYCPGLLTWLMSWAGNYALVFLMAANALCWELFLAPLVRRGLGCLLCWADTLAEVYWPDRGLLQLLDWKR